MKYNTEEEFLKDYNKNDYDLLSVTTDILLLSVSDKDVDNYRKLKEKKYSLYLLKEILILLKINGVYLVTL